MNSQVKNCSLITGVVHDEGTFWLMYGIQGINQTTYFPPKKFTQLVSDVLKPPGYDQGYIVRLAQSVYLDSIPKMSHSEDMQRDVLDDISGDTVFKCPLLDFTADFVANTRNHVFQYSFEHRLSNQVWPAWFGVAHGYELEAFFGIPFLDDNYDDKDREVSRKVMTWLSNFAKSG